MDDGENCLVTAKQSSKRRAMAATTEDSPQQELSNTKKKRVVLGEVTNVVDVGTPSSTNRVPVLKPKSQISTKTIAQKQAFKSVLDLHSSSSSDRLQKPVDSPLIYSHLRSLEAEEERRPLPDYMERVQKEITPSMREILVDWLVEVIDEFKLGTDTLYLTVNYIDRYLSSHSINKSKLQLLGVSSILVASKVEEITPPHVEDCCYMTDNTYTKEEVIATEGSLLKFLNYNTYNPTPKTFIRIFNQAAEVKMFSNIQFEFLASYIAELSLIDYTCVKFLPSVVAASTIFLARFTILPTIHPWSLELQRYTGYKASELKDCILAIHDLLLNKKGTSAQAVRHKYTEQKYQCVAALCPQSEIPRHYFEVVTGEFVSQESKS